MIRFIFALAMMFSINTYANDFVTDVAIQTTQVAADNVLGWTVGDTASYQMNLMQFLKGTAEMKVTQEVPQGFWLTQVIDMMGQKQNVEALVDKNTGAIIEMKVNGQKQNPPQAGEQEVVETREDKVTVPAGTFKTIYVKIHDKQANTNTQVWMNRKEVPVMGQVKMIAPTQLGAEITMELTSFKWAN